VLSEMGLLVGIILIILALLIFRWWVKRHPSKRKLRRKARGKSMNRRLIRKSGVITPAARCEECGEFVAICRTRTRDAEHAEGMIGPRKRKYPGR
jgi:hypothetical protein